MKRSADDLLGHVDYMCVCVVMSAHTGFKKVDSNVPQVSSDKVLDEKDLTKNCWRQVLCPEQRSVHR